jgi:hypothetical protein
VAAEGAGTTRMARLREGHNLQVQQGFRGVGGAAIAGGSRVSGGLGGQ